MEDRCNCNFDCVLLTMECTYYHSIDHRSRPNESRVNIKINMLQSLSLLLEKSIFTIVQRSSVNRVQFVIIVIVTVLWCTFASMKKVLKTSQKLCCTEFETTKIAADSVKFYCRLLVKLGLCVLSDSKLIKLNCVLCS